MISLLDKLNEYYRDQPDGICSASLQFSGEDIRSTPLTYRSLIYSALSIANYIQLYNNDSQPILISIEDPHLFLIVFIGILSVKRIAVPIPHFKHFKSPEAFNKRVLSICQDCQPSLVICDNVEAWVTMAVNTNVINIVHVNDINIKQNDSQLLPTVDINAIAYLQYTSGSTGNPKGAIITHKNVIANIIGCGRAASYSKNDIFVSWLPLYHDMGLLGGLLIPLYWKMALYLFTPAQFIARPLSWLKVIDRFRATITVGPSFAYQLIGSYVSQQALEKLDLSSLRLAYIGAEPIPLIIAKRFIERLQVGKLNPHCLYPCYGLAEATLAVSCPPINRQLVVDYVDRIQLSTQNKAVIVSNANDAIAFISVGHVLPDHEIMILDQVNGRVLHDRELGEIVVKGPSISPGYYPETTSQEFLKTGDLGYMANQELFVVDRIKDVIIIAGQNFYSMDIENSITSIPELENTVAVCFASRTENHVEELHIVVEVKKAYLNHNPVEHESLKKKISNVIQKEFNIFPRKISFIARGSLERTSSGKIVRNACVRANLVDSSTEMVVS